MLHRLLGDEIALIWSSGSELWQVKIDPNQISRIEANLCVNTRDAMQGIGGNVAAQKRYYITTAHFLVGSLHKTICFATVNRKTETK